MRGRKPIASAIQEASGAYIKDPQRRNKLEPKPHKGRPKLPTIIAGDVVACGRWDHVCNELELMNILTTADFYLLELHCVDYSMWWKLKHVIDDCGVSIESRTGSVSAKPEAKLMFELGNKMLKQIAELGLTPSARSRLKVVESKEESPFEAWLNSDN